MDPSPKFYKPEYSPDFQRLIAEEVRLRELIEGSKVITTPWSKEEAWRSWQDHRKFIAQAISKDGSFLDFGCANGFLIRCLQEWSSHNLDMYGIDMDEDVIKKAKQLFPDQASHFILATEVGDTPEYPRTYDTIYWNVWEDYNFEEKSQVTQLQSLLNAVKKDGRLILGFYEFKEHNRQKAIDQLQKLGYTFSGTLLNPDGGDQVLVWFDKV